MSKSDSTDWRPDMGDGYVFEPNCKVGVYYSGKPESYEARFEVKKFHTVLILHMEDKVYEPFYTEGGFTDELILKYKEETLYLHRDLQKRDNWVGRLVDTDGGWSLITVEMKGKEF